MHVLMDSALMRLLMDLPTRVLAFDREHFDRVHPGSLSLVLA